MDSKGPFYGLNDYEQEQLARRYKAREMFVDSLVAWPLYLAVTIAIPGLWAAWPFNSEWLALVAVVISRVAFIPAEIVTGNDSSAAAREWRGVLFGGWAFLLVIMSSVAVYCFRP